MTSSTIPVAGSDPQSFSSLQPQEAVVPTVDDGGLLLSALAVEKALNKARQRSTADALEAAYRYISQPKRMTQTEATYPVAGYDVLTAKIRAAIAIANAEVSK